MADRIYAKLGYTFNIGSSEELAEAIENSDIDGASARKTKKMASGGVTRADGIAQRLLEQFPQSSHLCQFQNMR